MLIGALGVGACVAATAFPSGTRDEPVPVVDRPIHHMPPVDPKLKLEIKQKLESIDGDLKDLSVKVRQKTDEQP